VIQIVKSTVKFQILTQNFEHFKSRACNNCNKSKCIQIQVHFYFALTLNAIALWWPTRVSQATCSSFPVSCSSYAIIYQKSH